MTVMFVSREDGMESACTDVGLGSASQIGCGTASNPPVLIHLSQPQIFHIARMVGLLDLPSELLFQIIDLVLSAPVGLSKHGRRHRPTQREGERNLYCVPRLEFLELPNALNLLLINQKICAETEEYLSKKLPTFKFDIAIVNDHWFWPTWREISVCKPWATIGKMEIRVILCCTEDERHLQDGLDIDNLGGNRGLAPDELWKLWTREMLAPVINFHRLNKMICKDDAEFCRASPSKDNGIGASNVLVPPIDTLEISIDTTPYSNRNELVSESEVPFRKIDGLAHLDFERLYPAHPRKSALLLNQMLSSINEWVYEDSGNVQGVVSRIGRVVFSLDGKPLLGPMLGGR